MGEAVTAAQQAVSIAVSGNRHNSRMIVAHDIVHFEDQTGRSRYNCPAKASDQHGYTRMIALIQRNV